MNSSLIRLSQFAILLSWFGTADFSAQPAATSRASVPLGLLRLAASTVPTSAPTLAVGKFAVDDLSPAGVVGAGKSRKDDVDVLALDAGKEWSRPLRGSPRDVSFVSFLLYASASTIVDLAGVRLGITASPAGGNLQLMYDDSTTGTLQWKSLNFHVGTGNYVGKTFAALPTLTIRLDPATNTWDLYSGSRLLADNLPMIAAKKDQRQFLLRAGSEGAWLTGLVMADENPLYEDANANGIDDSFERQKRGTLLGATTSVIERQLLAQEWKAAQRQKAPPALYVQRPMPDRFAAAAPPAR